MPQSTATYFDKRSTEWEELYAKDPRFARRFKLLTAFVTPLLSGHAISYALDYGCGTGIFSRWLAKHDVKVIGLDISTQMLARAKDLTPESLAISYTSDLSEIAGQRFDAIVAFSVLEYVDDVERLLKAFAASTSIGGVLIASIPNPNGGARLIESMIYRIRKLTKGKMFAGRGDYLAHQRWTLTPSQFDAMVVSLGYEKQKHLYYNAALDLSPKLLPMFERKWWAALYCGAYEKKR